MKFSTVSASRPMPTAPAGVGMAKPHPVPVGKLHRPIVTKPKTGFGVVTHNLSGPKDKKYVFHDPKLMQAHLVRTLNKNWLHPDANSAEAKKIDTTINLG